ncbi:hypothetical protein TNCV_2109611 [Trichonephila clavipes]|nr:hypothetical protein TNCV_2109611 [Trichonephila clavipes]
MVVEALLPIRLAAPIEAPESLLVVRYELPKRLPRKSHACSMGLRSGRSCRPIHTFNIPHSLRAVRQLLCDDMVQCRP